MPKHPPDHSFTRDARPLASWLLDLVSEEASTRLAAGEALQAMLYAIPSIHASCADIDLGPASTIAAHGERLRAAIRSAVDAPDFPAADFVRNLIRYRLALKDDWRRRMRNARHDPLLAPGPNPYADAEPTAPPGFMSWIVLKALDLPLLLDRPGLRAMLADKGVRHEAHAALARIGPPALDFAPSFLQQLDADPDRFPHHGAHPLGSIARDDPATIDALLARLRPGPPAVRSAAAAALYHAGPPLAGRLDDALDILLDATQTPALLGSALPALASLGRDDERALARVLDVARPRPPRIEAEPSSPASTFDAVMRERGVALDALAHFPRFPDQVVPPLVAALDDFDEYDPDWTYDGDHERVCSALSRFGPLAAPAVPRLVRILQDWPALPESEREWPKDVFRLLTSIGPAASAALPSLHHLRAAHADDDPANPSPLDPDDPLDLAILTLQGDGPPS